MPISKKYLSLAIFLFLIEVVIALFVHDTIVRSYVGDVLATEAQLMAQVARTKQSE